MNRDVPSARRWRRSSRILCARQGTQWRPGCGRDLPQRLHRRELLVKTHIFEGKVERMEKVYSGADGFKYQHTAIAGKGWIEAHEYCGSVADSGQASRSFL